jgi:hypothetical protein
MKKPFLIALVGALLAASSSAIPPTKEVSFKLGPTYFRDGDSVRIASVTSTSPNLEPGDTVIVTGKYRLQSRDKATLALYLTQTKSTEIEETAPAQKCVAKRGWHEFTSVITVKHRGLLHLTFYDCPLEGCISAPQSKSEVTTASASITIERSLDRGGRFKATIVSPLDRTKN